MPAFRNVSSMPKNPTYSRLQIQRKMALLLLATTLVQVNLVNAKSETEVVIDTGESNTLIMTGMGEVPEIGLETQWSGDYTRESIFDETGKVYLDELETALSLSGSTKVTENSQVYVSGSALAYLSKSGFSKRTDKNGYIELDELWLSWHLLQDPATTIRLGRQSWSDEHGWWWDSTLDALAYQTLSDKTGFSFALATTSRAARTDRPRQDPEEKDHYWLLGSINHAFSQRSSVQGFLTHLMDTSGDDAVGQTVREQDFDSQDDRLTWLGIRLRHSVSQLAGQRFSFSLDFAGIQGISDITSVDPADEDGQDEDSQDDELNDTEQPDTLTIEKTDRLEQSGWAIDARIDWQPHFAKSSTLSIGWAAGSSTNRNSDAGSKTYRPTGLQDYQTDGGLNYYGSALNPELGNLQISTLMLQTSVSETLRVALIFNDYRRMSAADDSLFNEQDLEYQTTGKSVGRGLGLSINLEFDELELDISASTFRAGEAFGELNGNRFSLVELAFTLDF